MYQPRYEYGFSTQVEDEVGFAISHELAEDLYVLIGHGNSENCSVDTVAELTDKDLATLSASMQSGALNEFFKQLTAVSVYGREVKA
jgi:hypothetical protein